MTKYKNLAVVCNCGCALADYKKGGSGRLRKMYFERILKDTAGIFLLDPRLKKGVVILCPACEKRVGTVAVVRGKYAVKINQGSVRL